MAAIRFLKPSWKIFCHDYILNENHRKAYAKAFPSCSAISIPVLSLRLLKKPLIQKYINEHADTILKEEIAEKAKIKAIEDLKDKMVSTTLSRFSKLELLSKIANGSIEIPKKRIVWDKEKKKNVTITIMEAPSAIERLRAIEIDNKMSGDYGIDKEAEVDLANLKEETNDAPPMNANQIVDALNTLRAVK